ncbi:MAG: FKBP-type peptidyl-prolyl cis-trans isomerase [bacterium]|nr:FKBP-type peptidyl-prolyl cis-trans isomerase [bacterium]MBU1918617.1 FKBP-type peptidyl-prolyl cis-trans isomerase [bacterium]
MKNKIIVIVLVFCLFASLSQATEMVTTDSKLRYQDINVGTGVMAEKGKKVVVHYTGWLNDADEKGNKFDSSVDRNSPFDFLLGLGFVIKGWDEGVTGMKIGGKRVLYIPSALGYGSRGAGSVIPPNSDLIFEVELLDVK